MAAGSTYTPIATTTIASAVASYTFSSITGSYTDLVLITNPITTANTDIKVRFNSDSGSNYSWTRLYGDGSSAASQRVSETYGEITNSRTTLISNSITHFQNYSNATTYKTYLSRGNAPDVLVAATVGLWRNTAAITSITLLPASGNLDVGTTFTLYGIASA
jgi:hypothetical protein